MPYPSIQNPDIVVQVAPSCNNLVILRHFISSLAKDLQFNSEEALQLELCVDEACANSVEGIRKKEGRDSTSPVYVQLKIENRSLHILIQDTGDDFTQAYNKAAPLHELTDRHRKRGYGLQIIKTFMDEVVYCHDSERGNFLLLVKDLPDSSSSL